MGGCRICEGAGRSRCPIHSTPVLARVRAEISKSHFFGDSPPSVFIGHHGYPRVRAGVLAPPIGGEELDAPAKWFERRLGIPEVVEKRLSLVNMTFSADIKRPLRAEYFSEISLAVNPTEVEARTARGMNAGVSFDKFHSPMGPSARLESLKVTSNPKIPSKVDAAIAERLPAAEAVNGLFADGFDVYYLQRILSAGFLGRARKLVPTRWSITAADSIVSERLARQARGYPHIGKPLLFHSKHLDNEFHVILVPAPWAFEQIEGYFPGTTVMVDTEFHDGRKEYAFNVAGGYYAGRLAVAEYLEQARRQAAVLVIRSIGSGYYAPLGVWQVRENVRAAMAGKPREFETFGDALAAVVATGRLTRQQIFSSSKLIPFLKNQRRLAEF